MEVNLRTLGRLEAAVVLSLRERGKDVAVTQDIIDILKSEQSARKVVRNLVRKGWLVRIKGGRYLLLPPERGADVIGENNPLAVAAAVVDGSYVGWWSAAAFHGFTTQRPAKVFVAVTRQTKPCEIEGTEIHFVMTTPKKFFGWKQYDVYDRKVLISDPEKTLLDCIDKPAVSGGLNEVTRIVHEAMAEVDHDVLIEHAVRMGSISLLQRLGFLSDLVRRPIRSDLRNKLRASIPKSSRSRFGRSEKEIADIGYVSEWGLFVHAVERDLLTEVPQIINDARARPVDPPSKAKNKSNEP